MNSTELYKDGIVEVTEVEDDEEEDEYLFEVAVHFDNDIFVPNVFFESKDWALQQAKLLYDWLEESNPKEIKKEQMRWRLYTVNRKSLREYPVCSLPYYYSIYDEQSLEVSTFEQEAIIYGWLNAEPLPYYMDKEDGLIVLGGISHDAVLAGWCKATDIRIHIYSFLYQSR